MAPSSVYYVSINFEYFPCTSQNKLSLLHLKWGSASPKRDKIRKKSLFLTVLLPFLRSHLILKAVISYIIQFFMGVIKTRRHKLEEKKKQRRWISLSTGCCSLFSYMALVYRMALSTDNGRMPPFVLFIFKNACPLFKLKKEMITFSPSQWKESHKSIFVISVC